MFHNWIRLFVTGLLAALAIGISGCSKREPSNSDREIPATEIEDPGPISSPRGEEVAEEVKEAIQENGSGGLAQPNALVELLSEVELPVRTPQITGALNDKVQNFLDIDESKLESDERGEYIAQAMQIFGALSEKAAKDSAPLFPLPGESYLGEMASRLYRTIRFRFVGRYENGVTVGGGTGGTEGGSGQRDRAIPEGDLTWIRFFQLPTNQEWGSGEPLKDGTMLMKFIRWPQWPATLDDTQPGLLRGRASNTIVWTKDLVQTTVDDPVQIKTAELYRRLGNFVRLGVLLLSPKAKKFFQSMPRPVAQLIFQNLYGIDMPWLTGENR